VMKSMIKFVMNFQFSLANNLWDVAF
ncbi:uncharacterized protein METZ01_LOCUS149306, partial [marine metagenome]